MRGSREKKNTDNHESKNVKKKRIKISNDHWTEKKGGAGKISENTQTKY